VALALAGCAVAQESPLNGEWHVEDIAGGGIIDNSNVTLDFFEPGRLAGSGGCNRYTAGIAQDAFRLGPVASTMMMCPEALMNQEQKFFAALQTVTRYDVDETGALRFFAGEAADPVVVARRR
jgi:heat shock protein HslJ